MKSLIFQSIFMCIAIATAIPLKSPQFTGQKQISTPLFNRSGQPSRSSSRDSHSIVIGPDLLHDTPVQYSANWAGAIQINTNITQVSAMVITPNISAPSGGANNTRYGGSAWLGIDGFTCRKAIFQTGIDWTTYNGKAQYHAWFEWYPEYTHNFNLSVKAGDRMNISAVIHNSTSGTATIVNESSGVRVSHTFVGQQPLCRVNAEWVVEDYDLATPSGSGLVPYAKFDAVHFSNTSYIAAKGRHGVKNSTILDMKQHGNILTTCSTHGVHHVTCTYQ